MCAYGEVHCMKENQLKFLSIDGGAASSVMEVQYTYILLNIKLELHKHTSCDI